MPAKQLLQEACKRSLRWDDDLSNLPGLGMHWKKWLQALPQLERVSIKRSLTSPEREVAGFELHNFSDASISGYGVSVYVRVRYVDGEVKCCFLLGKARVAPIKFVSVPRLELTAALLAAKGTNFVINELDIKFSKVFLWTDSTVVLRYINCTSVRFTTFVANRLEILHSLTNCEQWHYVPSKQNPADIASRGVWPDKIDTCDMWFYGPSFLCNNVSDWPNQPDFLHDIALEELEVKNEHCFAQLREPNDSLHRLFRRYSSFHDLLRTVSWLLRYKNFLFSKLSENHASPNVGFLTVEEFDQARLAIMRCVQREAFPRILALSSCREALNVAEDIKGKDLQQNKDLKIVQTLNPFVKDGLLRVGGRLRNSSLAKDSKHPIILPKRHPFTELVVMRCHETEGHMGTFMF